MTGTRLIWVICAGLTLGACGDDDGTDASDAGPSDSGAMDSGASDAGPSDAGADDAGADDAGQGDGGVADAGADDAGPEDAGVAANVDGGPVLCDPLQQDECPTGQRCSWVRITPDIGESRCVADGTLEDAAECTVDPSTGIDDCRRGSICVGGACRAICALADETSCADGGTCAPYAGVFTPDTGDRVVGACNPSCDPLTQLRTDGTDCGAGQGCYLFTRAGGIAFGCAAAGSVAIGADVTGAPFANVCVPGGIIARRANGTSYCSAYCRPVETHAGAPEGAAGMSPHSCPDRGLASPNECRFGWAIVSSSDPRLNDLGVCFDRTGIQYDSDGDGVVDAPSPSCTELPNTDTDGDTEPQHLEFGCAPRL